ncbi:MAG: hypothetical protein IT322_07110 [Anaerolineae bacterium]|nr:hypothetical protein [Anaerolineae bacterium]
MRRLLIPIVVVLVLSLSLTPAFAAAEKSVTITEAQANELYRVKNPIRPAVSNVSVDFQPGVVIITSTVTRRNAAAVIAITTYAPYLKNGRLYWTVTARTKDGTAVPADALAQINASISTSWFNFIRGKLPAGKITGIVITGTDLSISYTTPR